MKDKLIKYKEKIAQGYKVVREFFHETYNKHIIYMYIAIAIIVTLVIEMMARGSIFKGIYFLIGVPYIFICNAVIVLMTLSISLLMRRRFFGLSVISAIWITFGISNAVLLANRVTPFTAVDMMLIESAFGVMNKYFKVWQVVLICIVIALAVMGLIVMFFKAPKVKHKIKYIRNVIAMAIIWGIGFGALKLGLASGLIPEQFGNLRNCYNDYGFVYCFSNSLVNTGIKKPSDYSDKTIKKIVESNNAKKKVKKKPNIIFLQLESFFNLNNMKNIELSKNPVPTFEELYKKYPSGYFNVPIVGAGTVNTEFEVMTGMNLDDFGPGEYPFKTKLKENACESICFNLRTYGYKSHAIHNNTGTFYGRNIVFSNLGYDTFTSIENMNITEFTPMEWAKDKFLTAQILDTLKATKEKDFIYAISVQGHGSYPGDGDYDYPITVSGIEDENLKNQYQYYAWQTNEMDDFIKELTDKLSEYKEDTILVMYGDHLPSLGITADDLINEDVYQTQYIIWSNYKTKYTNEDIEAYQLESKILKQLNMTEGKINNYTQEHKDTDDNAVYLEGLHNLSYDQLYGENLATNGKNPYEPTDLQFGLHKVMLNSITPMDDDEGTIVLYGRYFTKYSKVYINGKKVETEFVDTNILRIKYPDLKDGDIFSVYQQNSNTHILNTTEEYEFSFEEGITKKSSNDSETETDKKAKKKKSSKKKK